MRRNNKEVQFPSNLPSFSYCFFEHIANVEQEISVFPEMGSEVVGSVTGGNYFSLNLHGGCNTNALPPRIRILFELAQFAVPFFQVNTILGGVQVVFEHVINTFHFLPPEICLRQLSTTERYGRQTSKHRCQSWPVLHHTLNPTTGLTYVVRVV